MFTEWNTRYFGKEVRPVDILVTRSVSNPGSTELRETVAKAAKKIARHLSAEELDATGQNRKNKLIFRYLTPKTAG